MSINCIINYNKFYNGLYILISFIDYFAIWQLNYQLPLCSIHTISFISELKRSWKNKIKVKLNEQIYIFLI